MNRYRSDLESHKTPGFVQPFLNALNQIHRSDVGGTDQCVERAKKCLTALRGGIESDIVTGGARGGIGLQADHTHYFDGFALMLQMRRGMAIAVAPGRGPGSRLLVEGEKAIRSFSLIESSELTTSEADTVRLLKHVVEAFPHDMTSPLDISLSSEIPGGLLPVFASSFAVALHRALENMSGVPFEDLERVRSCQRAIEAFYKCPFSPAYIRAANISDSHTFVLVDTRSLSYVSLDIGDSDKPGWGLVDSTPEISPEMPAERFSLAQDILERLKSKKFKEITTIRDLEHRDFDVAEKSLPRKMRPGFRFLVSENKRVQQLVTAIRRSDWQLCGTILLISHQARKECWHTTTTRQDELVNLAERFSNSGVYGATQTGESAFVLIAGQPFSIPGFLDEVRNHTFSTDEKHPQTIIL